MNRRVMLMWIVSPLLLGCAASFPVGEVGSLEPWPPPRDGEAKSLQVIVSGRVTIDKREVDVSPTFVSDVRAEVIRAYEDSELFSTVVEAVQDTDIQAEVRTDVDAAREPAMLWLIPWRTTDVFTMTTTIKDHAGRELGSVTATESVRTWHHLFMAPFVFTNLPVHIWKRALYDLTRRTIIDAHQEDML